MKKLLNISKQFICIDEYIEKLIPFDTYLYYKNIHDFVVLVSVNNEQFIIKHNNTEIIIRRNSDESNKLMVWPKNIIKH